MLNTNRILELLYSISSLRREWRAYRTFELYLLIKISKQFQGKAFVSWWSVHNVNYKLKKCLVIKLRYRIVRIHDAQTTVNNLIFKQNARFFPGNWFLKLIKPLIFPQQSETALTLSSQFHAPLALASQYNWVKFKVHFILQPLSLISNSIENFTLRE